MLLPIINKLVSQSKLDEEDTLIADPSQFIKAILCPQTLRYQLIHVLKLFSVVFKFQNLFVVVPHWCIKLISNGVAIAIASTFKVVPFCFCSAQGMPLFRISCWLVKRGDKNLAYSGLRLFGGFSNI